MKLHHPQNGYAIGDVLIPYHKIQKRILEISTEIETDYSGEDVLIVSIMKGSFMVTADLIRALHTAGIRNMQVSAITVGSYGAGTVSTKKMIFKHDVDINVKSRDILLVEDIVDTGRTLKYVIDSLKKRSPASIRSFSLLSKPARREVAIEPDYTGFEIPDVWVQGYGMDTDEWGRGNPNIIIGPVKEQISRNRVF